MLKYNYLEADFDNDHFYLNRGPVESIRKAPIWFFQAYFSGLISLKNTDDDYSLKYHNPKADVKFNKNCYRIAVEDKEGNIVKQIVFEWKKDENTYINYFKPLYFLVQVFNECGLECDDFFYCYNRCRLCQHYLFLKTEDFCNSCYSRIELLENGDFYEDGYVYVAENGLNHIKIGSTKSFPSLRLKQLQTGSSTEVVLKGFFVIKNYSDFEKQLHQKFKERSLNGEWFNLSHDEAYPELMNLNSTYYKLA